MKFATMRAAALLLLAGGAAHAHQFHAGMTEVSANPRTGSVEIVHTLMTHDVDALLANLYQRQLDLSQPEDEAALRKYVESHFAIAGKDGKPLPAHWVGVSPGVDSVTVYQEIEHTPLAALARVRDELLTDFLPDQRNILNLRQNGEVRTLQFSATSTERSFGQ